MPGLRWREFADPGWLLTALDASDSVAGVPADRPASIAAPHVGLAKLRRANPRHAAAVDDAARLNALGSLDLAFHTYDQAVR